MLWSLYEATGLVEYPGFEGYRTKRVDFGFEEVCEIEAFDVSRFKLPTEWMESALRVAQGKVDLIVLELYCQLGSAISRACEKGHRAYFGVTKSVDFLSYNCLGCLVELLKCLAEGFSVKVWCHISTTCTAGCGLRHPHMKNESFLPKWRELIAQLFKVGIGLLGCLPGIATIRGSCLPRNGQRGQISGMRKAIVELHGN